MPQTRTAMPQPSGVSSWNPHLQAEYYGPPTVQQYLAALNLPAPQPSGISAPESAREAAISRPWQGPRPKYPGVEPRLVAESDSGGSSSQQKNSYTRTDPNPDIADLPRPAPGRNKRALQTIDPNLLDAAPKAKRKQWRAGEKLEVVDFHHNERMYWEVPGGGIEEQPLSYTQTGRVESCHRSSVRAWELNQQKLLSVPADTIKIGCGRTPKWSRIESPLFEWWDKLDADGHQVTKQMFVREAKRIFEEQYPEQITVDEHNEKQYPCKFSQGWWNRFRDRHKAAMAYRKQTTATNKQPQDLEEAAVTHLEFTRRNALVRSGEQETDVGRFKLSRILNFDQMALPFEMANQYTITRRGAATVPARVDNSAWVKRQATFLVPVFADGMPHLRPTLVFRGTGSVEKHEKQYYDSRVKVLWQPNAWCDTPTMVVWIQQELAPALAHESTSGAAEPALVLLDANPSHHTEATMKELAKLAGGRAVIDFIPESMTPYLQEDDTHVNSSLRVRLAQELAEAKAKPHYGLPQIPGKPNALRDRRILMTHVAAHAFYSMHEENERKPQQENTFVKAFRQNGHTLKVDGSEDAELLKVQHLPELHKKIRPVDEIRTGGLNCNLSEDGRTGTGLCEQDDWPTLLQAMVDNNCFAKPKDVAKQIAAVGDTLGVRQ